ncbi:unnamed protein product [Oncorhynchus mykiss]|uniref:Ig-like domain-containing protein n=1 Tax=Oncorhynchus mykiss TaxID=8022 RepID=A0A060Z0T7_ONCMY|nr:unnamed protein product [Oncorhynchus mykiss]
MVAEAFVSGVYRCIASSSVGKDELDMPFYITVLEAPVLLQNLSDCSVNISSSVTLSCRAHGVPRPFITWYKDQHTLLQGSGIVIAQGGENLHIDRITVEDQGLYTCQATNERGSAESSAYIWVHSKDPLTNSNCGINSTLSPLSFYNHPRWSSIFGHVGACG